MAEPQKDNVTGQDFEVVAPGSDEDPFTKGGGKASVDQTPVENPSDSPQVPAQPPAEEPAAPAPEPTKVVVPPSQIRPAAPPAAAAAPPADKPDAAPSAAEPAAAPAVAPEPAAAAPAQEPVQGDLASLAEAMKGLAKEATEEALRGQQSTYDRMIAGLKNELTQRDEDAEAMKQEVRRLQLNGLEEDEREKLQAVWEQEDKTAELVDYGNNLEEYHRELLIRDYSGAYEAFGVTSEALSVLETPEEMESLCLEAKAKYYEDRYESGQAGPPAPEPVSAAPAAPAVPATPAAPAPPNVPAGAEAPSDVGGGGTAPTEKQLSTEQSPDALAENLKNLPTETIRVG